MLRLGIALEELLVTSSETRLELMHLGFELAEMRRRSARVLFDRSGRFEQNLLLHESDPGAASQGDISGVSRFQAGGDAHQGGLPHPVRPDETDTVTVREPEGHLAENEPLAKALGDRLDRVDAHDSRGSQRGTLAR